MLWVRRGLPPSLRRDRKHICFLFNPFLTLIFDPGKNNIFNIALLNWYLVTFPNCIRISHKQGFVNILHISLSVRCFLANFGNIDLFMHNHITYEIFPYLVFMKAHFVAKERVTTLILSHIWGFNMARRKENNLKGEKKLLCYHYDYFYTCSGVCASPNKETIKQMSTIAHL